MKPIIFNGEMVRAILDGRKTQTRRPIKVQPSSVEIDGDWIWMRWPIEKSGNKVGVKFSHNCWKPKPYKVGDILYVRETLCRNGEWPVYAADFESVMLNGQPVRWRWKVKTLIGRYMPKELSRIHLEVTRVRVDRACEINEEDARAEGVVASEFRKKDQLTPHRNEFRSLWQSIYGPDAWEKCVWVYDFKRI